MGLEEPNHHDDDPPHPSFLSLLELVQADEDGVAAQLVRLMGEDTLREYFDSGLGITHEPMIEVEDGHWLWNLEHQEDSGVTVEEWQEGWINASQEQPWTGEVFNFGPQLLLDGVPLKILTDAEQSRFLVNREAFKRWLLHRYLSSIPVYSTSQLDRIVTVAESAVVEEYEGRLEDAHADWESGLTQELEEARLAEDAARSGWVPLSRLAKATETDIASVRESVLTRYTLGEVKSNVWGVRWFDAFQWLSEYYARRWDVEAEEAQREIEWLRSKGVSEEDAVDKVRRDFISESAARPIAVHTGIHTLTDRDHLVEGHTTLGVRAKGEILGYSNDVGWEPYSPREGEAGFPLWGEGGGSY